MPEPVVPIAVSLDAAPDAPEDATPDVSPAPHAPADVVPQEPMPSAAECGALPPSMEPTEHGVGAWVRFRYDQCRVMQDSFVYLHALARYVLCRPNVRFEVQGHQAHRWHQPYRSLNISQCRANAVMTFMIELGVDRQWLEAHGYGDDRPLVRETDTPSARGNQRIEVQALPAPTP